MRWLMVCLLVSLAALLTAAAMARHIRARHAELRREPLSRVDTARETDPEP